MKTMEKRNDSQGLKIVFFWISQIILDIQGHKMKESAGKPWKRQR